MAETEDKDSELIEIQARFEAAKDHATEWRREARDAFGFYAGDQWDEEDRQKLMEQQRVPITFNRTAILVDAVVGYEMNNRQETRYIPRSQGDAKVNELLTEAANYFRDQCDAEFEESDAFRDMLICGMGWTEDRLSDEKNPAYDIFRDRVDPLEMLWDPSSRKPNLEDRRYQFRKKWMDKAEAKAILPEWDGAYVHADWLADDMDTDGDTASINPRNRYRDGIVENSAVRDVPVLEYQYIKHLTQHMVANPMTGEQLTLDEEQWDKLDDDTKELAETKQIPHAVQRTTEFHRCFMIGAEIVKRDQPFKTGFTYQCITGKRDRNKGTWFGIIKSLHDPQMWSNKWLSQIMHLINTSAKPGYDVEKGAIDNQAKFEKDAARPGAVNVFVDGALQKQRIQRREAVGLPPDLSNLMQYANDAMSDVSGINQELLGMADREQPGILEYQRKQSAVTLLAPLFDSFRRYRKMAGRCWLYFMQNYLSDGRLIRITQDDGTQKHLPFAPGPEGGDPTIGQFFDPEVAEYDVVIDQSASAPNQKEATFSAIQPLLPILQESAGPQEMALIMEYSPLPESFMEKWKQIQQEREQQPPPPSPEEMKVQADMQMKQQQLEFDQQKGQADSQLKQQDMQMSMAMKQQDLETTLQLERAKAEASLQLEREKAAQQFELDKLKLANQMELERVKVRGQIEIERLKAGAQMQLAAQNAEADNERADREMKANEARADGEAKTESDSKAQITGVFKDLTDALLKPKKIVRGKDNRIEAIQ